MGQKYLSLLLIFLIAGIHTIHSQPKTEKIKESVGTRINTGPVVDESLNEIYTSEFVRNSGLTGRKITWKKDLNGQWTFTNETYTPSGKVETRLEGKLELRDGKLVVVKYTLQDNSDKEVSRRASGELDSFGKFHVKETREKSSTEVKEEYDLDYDEIGFLNRLHRPPFQEEKKVTQNSKDNALYYAYKNPNDDCGKKFIVSLGPAYLNRNFGDETKSCWGVNLNGNYNITSNIAVGVDLSAFNVKVGDDKLRTSFYLAEGRYNFGRGETECKPTISVFSRIAIGMMNERYRDKTGSGAVYGGGVGANCRMSEAFKVGLAWDYFFAKVNDGSINSHRVALFVRYGIGVSK